MCGRPTSLPKRCRGWPITRCTARPSSSAAGFAEMALAAGSRVLAARDGQVNALAIERPLILDAHTRITTQLSQDAGGNRVEIHARSAGGMVSLRGGRHRGSHQAAPAGAPRRRAEHRDRAARRGRAPPRVPHPPRAAGRRVAATGRRHPRCAGRRDVVSAGFGRDDPGVRRRRRPGALPCRAGRAGAGRLPGRHRPHRRNRDAHRGAGRYRTASGGSQLGAAGSGAEDLRRRVGVEPGTGRRRGARRHLGGAGRIRPRDNGVRRADRGRVPIADAPSGHRGAVG